MIDKITDVMKEIISKNKSDVLYSKNGKQTIKYDVRNEFVFVSSSGEDLKNVDCVTYYLDPMYFNRGSDVTMYDLEYLEDYSDSELQIIYDLLGEFLK